MGERNATARQLVAPASGPPLRVVHAPQPGARTLGNPSILHVRIDAFAVAVVVRNQPAWRELAVIIGGDAQGRGPVLAASRVAREEGVQPGMTLRAAEKLCPRALVMPADPRAIDAAAQEALDVLGRYTPLVEPEWIAAGTRRKAMVVDEQRLAQRFGATLDVHGCERLFGPATEIAMAIRADLAARGYTARIGVASNPALAAVASAVAGLESPLAVPAGQEQAFLESIPLTLFEEFEPEIIERLRSLGIRVAGQFACLPEAAVRRRFGQAGRLAHEQARGVAQRPVVAPPTPVMLEAACSLEDPTTDGLWLDRELARLAEQLAEKLGARGQSAALLTLTVIQHGRSTEAVSRRLHLKQPVAGAPAILARARELFVQAAPDRPVTDLRLEAAALGAAASQMPLPLVDVKLAGHEKLDAVAQRLRGRFGVRAARRAHLVADALLPEDRVSWEGPAISTARPRVIEVRVDASGRPVAVRRDPRPWEPLRAICSQWRIRANWWSIPHHRHYYLVETARGAVLELYQEQSDGVWYLAGRRD